MNLSEKSEKNIVRILQIISAIAAAGALVLLLLFFGIIPYASVLSPNAETTDVPRKIKKPKKQETVANIPKKIPAVALTPMENVKKFLKERRVAEAKTSLDAITIENQETLYYKGFIAAFLNETTAAKDFLTKSLTAGSNEVLKTSAQKMLNAYRDFELSRDGKIEHLQIMLAAAFDDAGEFGLSIELALNAIKTQPNYRDAWIVLGHAFLNEEKWLDGLDALTKAINLDTNHPATYFFRGLAKKKLNKPPIEWLSDFSKARELGFKPQILAKFEMAEAYFALHDYAAAYELYKEVVVTDPSDIERFIRPMALAIFDLEKPGEALELAEKAAVNHPGTAWSYNLLGWGNAANDRFDEAKAYLDEALRLEPDFDAAYLNLGFLFERRGDFNQATQNYAKAQELAEMNKNASIGETAKHRFERLSGTKLSSNEPQLQYIPSLSLE